MSKRFFTLNHLSLSGILYLVIVCLLFNSNGLLFAQLPNHGCDHFTYCIGTPNWSTETKIIPVPGYPFCYAKVEFELADDCAPYLSIIKINNIQYMGGCQNLLMQIYPFGVNGPPNEIFLRQLYGEIQKSILGLLLEETFAQEVTPNDREKWYCTKPDGTPNNHYGLWQQGILTGACMSVCTAYLQDNNDPTKYIIGHKYLDCVENNCCSMIHYYCIDRNTNKAVFLNGQSVNHGINGTECITKTPPVCPIFSAAGYSVLSTYSGNCEFTCPESN